MYINMYYVVLPHSIRMNRHVKMGLVHDSHLCFALSNHQSPRLKNNANAKSIEEVRCTITVAFYSDVYLHLRTTMV